VTSEQERRRHERSRIRVPLYIEFPEGIFQKNVAIEALDVSKGGLSFETSRAVPEGAEARIMVARLGGLPDQAQIEARVIHSEPSVDGRSTLVGVQFIQLVGVTAEELIARLEAWGPETT
jgi:PilZ domain